MTDQSSIGVSHPVNRHQAMEIAMNKGNIWFGLSWVGSKLISRASRFSLLWFIACNLAVATATAAGPLPLNPETMSETDLLATASQLTEQKFGLTKYALPRVTGKVKEFAERSAAISAQEDTKVNDLTTAGVSTMDPTSPTLPDAVGAVQGLEGPALSVKYVQTMLDLSRTLLPLFVQMDARAKNTRLKAFGHEYAEVERKLIKDLETLNAQP